MKNPNLGNDRVPATEWTDDEWLAVMKTVPPNADISVGEKAVAEMRGILEDLTWTCHVCKEERPDDKISVLKKPLKFGGMEGTENVRYCNDRPACIEGAKSFSHFKRDFTKDNDDEINS